MKTFLALIVLMLMAIAAGILTGCSNSADTGNHASLTVNLLTP